MTWATTRCSPEPSPSCAARTTTPASRRQHFPLHRSLSSAPGSSATTFRLGRSLLRYLMIISPAPPREVVAEAIACTERSGDHLTNSVLHMNAGYYALSAGNVPAARAHLDAAVQPAQAIGYVNTALTVNLGWVLRAEGDPDVHGPRSRQACGSVAGSGTASAWPRPALAWRASPAIWATGTGQVPCMAPRRLLLTGREVRLP